MFDERATESLVNKLVYNTNIEACYLQGDFGVYEKNGLKKGEKLGAWFGEEFYIADKMKVINDLIFDGYPFFAGNITLKKVFTYEDGDCVLKIEGEYGYAEIFVNGKPAKKPYFSDKVDVTSLVKKGENQIEITLYTGNRNLLGPHHNVAENCGWAGPGTFELTTLDESDKRYLFAEVTIKPSKND